MNNDRRPSGAPQMPSLRGRGHGGPMGARVNGEKPKNMKRTLVRLLKYIGKSKLLVIALVTIMGIVTLADLEKNGYTLAVNAYIEKPPAPPIDPVKVKQEYFAALDNVKECEERLYQLLKEGGYLE